MSILSRSRPRPTTDVQYAGLLDRFPDPPAAVSEAQALDIIAIYFTGSMLGPMPTQCEPRVDASGRVYDPTTGAAPRDAPYKRADAAGVLRSMAELGLIWKRGRRGEFQVSKRTPEEIEQFRSELQSRADKAAIAGARVAIHDEHGNIHEVHRNEAPAFIERVRKALRQRELDVLRSRMDELAAGD
jgi:hypothetical protein